MGHLSTGKSLLNKIITSISTDSRAKKKVTNLPQVNSEYGFLWPLHIKFDLMTIFVNAMDKNSSMFLLHEPKFLKISEAKIKEGIFVGPNLEK
jgi:hypothetical protein